MKSLLSMMGVLCAIAASGGTQYTYQGKDGLWNRSGNWNPQGIPAAGDRAIFTGAAKITDEIAIGKGMLSIETQGNVELAGLLSGEGGINHYGSKDLKILCAENTFMGPVTNFWGKLISGTLANGGQPSSLGAGTGAIYIKGGNWEIVQGGETDRQVHFNGATSVSSWNKTARLTGPVSGTLFKRGTGELIIDSYLGSKIDRVSTTEMGMLRLNNPTNDFKANPQVSILAGTLAIQSLADKGVPCSAGAGEVFSFNQYQWNTKSILVYEGEQDAQSNRDFLLAAYKDDTPRGDYPMQIYCAKPGVKLTLNGKIIFANPCGPYPTLLIGGEGDGELSQPLERNISVKKEGTGTWILSAENPSTGKMEAFGGTLQVDGSIAGGADVAIQSEATLSGCGIVHAPTFIASAGRLSAGSSTRCGTLSFDHPETPLTVDANSLLIAKVSAETNDVIRVTGAITPKGAMRVKVIPLADEEITGRSYTLMTWDAPPPSWGFILDDGMNGQLEVTEKALVYTASASVAEIQWKGDGVQNRWDTTTRNWENDALYQDGLGVRFGETGSNDPEITIAAPVAPHKITVDAETKDYTFTGEKITGTGSLLKTGAGTLTLANPNDFRGSLQLRQGTVRLDGVFDSVSVVGTGDSSFIESPAGSITGDDISLTFGYGPVSLGGTNTFTGSVVFDARKQKEKGIQYYRLENDYSLGQASSLTIYPKNIFGEHNATILEVTNSLSCGKNCTMKLGRNIETKDQIAFFLQIPSRPHIEWNWYGNLDVLTGTGIAPTLRARCYNKTSTMNFGTLGETTIRGFSNIYMRGLGVRRFYSTIQIPQAEFWTDDAGVTEFHSTNNLLRVICNRQGTLRAHAENIFVSTVRYQLGKNAVQWGGQHDSIFDLNGFDQTVGMLEEIEIGRGGYRIVKSDLPATLTISGTQNCSFGSVRSEGTATDGTPFVSASDIQGSVSLLKDGASTFTLNAPNTFTGSVTVCNGTLRANAKGALGAGEKWIEVKGGTLDLTATDAIQQDASLRIPILDGTEGVINLAANTQQTIQNLYQGDREMPAGTYGSPDTQADHKYPCFTGTGILRVLHGMSGTCILLQ